MIGAAAEARSCLSGCWKYWRLALWCLREPSSTFPGSPTARVTGELKKRKCVLGSAERAGQIGRELRDFSDDAEVAVVGEGRERGARNDVRSMPAVGNRDDCVSLAVKNPRRRGDQGRIERPRPALHGDVLSEPADTLMKSLGDGGEEAGRHRLVFEQGHVRRRSSPISSKNFEPPGP